MVAAYSFSGFQPFPDTGRVYYNLFFHFLFNAIGIRNFFRQFNYR
jgi:hypothetical protein